MKSQKVILRKNKDKAIRNRHHWIFSGAVKSMPEFEDGSILPVESAEGELLGHAYFNKRCSIIGRMVSFGSDSPHQAIEKNIESALALRQSFFDEKTNAFRLVNAEGDSLPGLIVDRYHDTLVIQIATLGMEKLKPFILDMLVKKIGPRSIYEKSALPSRREEGLADFEGHIFGDKVDRVEIMENGLRFWVELAGSQKTGFFLDQRENRQLVRALSREKKVLDCFSYTGAFSVYALSGGAKEVYSVDTSEKAIESAKENRRINGFEADAKNFYVEDVFEFLRRTDGIYDFIILDPPAFAKRRTDVVRACRGYKDINRIAIQKILPRSLIFTFSCSYFVDENLFQKVIFQAAGEAKRKVSIIHRHRQALDHPLNIFHPESEYLKGLLLYIE
jgi:23S rRNA (cytosine1962-C5)-methyltransferase